MLSEDVEVDILEEGLLVSVVVVFMFLADLLLQQLELVGIEGWI